MALTHTLTDLLYRSASAEQGILINIAELGFLVWMSVNDCRTMEVPLYIHLVSVGTQLFLLGLTGRMLCLPFNLMEAGLLFLLFLEAGLLFGLGGADILAVTGMAVGNRYTIIGCMIACGLALLYRMMIREKEKEFPFLPFLTAGYAAVTVYQFIM